MHAWDVFEQHGWEQTIISPRGGVAPLEPRSLKWPTYNASVRAWHADKSRMALLETTLCPDEVNPSDFDALYFTGGHAVMYDFPEDEGLQRLTRNMWENGKIVSSVCHGYCGLLNVSLSDGSYLVSDKKLTGFAWREEILAGVSAIVPYNAEEEMKKRGAHYRKAWLPFAPYVIEDDRLITGQNPTSATATARAVARRLLAAE